MSLIHRLCRKLTNHRFRKGVGYGVCLPTEYYYKCSVCGYRFWNWVPYKGSPAGTEMERIVHDYEDRHEFPRGHFDYRSRPRDVMDNKTIAAK